MTIEFDKIAFFLAEVKKQWATNPELALSREFYSLWETVHCPRPFAVPPGGLRLGDVPLELARDADRVAYFAWDEAEACPALMMEGRTVEQKVLILPQDGEPVIEEQPPVVAEEETLSFGERLEIVYDVISHVQRTQPATDIRGLKGKRFLQALEGVAEWHSARAIRIMKRIPAKHRDRLVTRAVNEMAVDEVTNQLELPLAGSYAAVSSPRVLPAAGDLSVDSEAVGACTIPARTPWAIRADLELILRGVQVAREQEQSFGMVLAGADMLGRDGACLVLRLPAQVDMPIQEGTRLRVFRQGIPQAVGGLRIIIVDDSVVYAHLDWADPHETFPLDERLCAIPQRSPLEFLAAALEAVKQAAETPAGLNTPGSRAVLGFDPFQYEDSRPAARGGLDLSQQRAHDNAVNPANALVLVQGPPGTGKTTVLEQVVRTLSAQGMRILATAPSNTAVDNICRRIGDLPVLRLGYQRQVVSPDVAEACWSRDPAVLRRFAERRREAGSCVYAATHMGVLRAELVNREIEEHGTFDVIVFDEGGMTALNEFLPCMVLARRVVVFGDHQQLPPHPLPASVLARVAEDFGAVPRSFWALLEGSALQWLAERRHVPVVLLQCSYRCHNPRLMRFASTLFYNARVRPSEGADYYRLSYAERRRQFPAATLRFLCTSSLPEQLRAEKLVIEGQKTGFENPTEAALCLWAFLDARKKYPLDEITLIAPYRRQIRLLRRALDALRETCPDDENRPSAEEWARFRRDRISTVDSFQGGENDAVIICYVRSNPAARIGFVDDPNRVNVAHTRARRSMTVVGDLECLKRGARNRIFERMERAFRRDGELIDVDAGMVREWLPAVRSAADSRQPTGVPQSAPR